MRKSSLSPFIALLFSVCMTSVVFGDTTYSIQLIKTSVQNQMAVIKMPDGQLKVIKAGEQLAGVTLQTDNSMQQEVASKGAVPKNKTTKEKKRGMSIRVVEVGDDRVVLEELTPFGPDTIVLSLVEDKDAAKEKQAEKKTEKKTEIERISRHHGKMVMPLGVMQQTADPNQRNGQGKPQKAE